MKRALFVCVLSILLIVPASVGVYAFAFLNDPAAEEQEFTPATKVVSNFVNATESKQSSRPDAVYLARKTKDGINETLTSNTSAIASRKGFTTDEVVATIDGMEIENWKSASLPDSATISQSFEMNLNGENSLVTTYNYPNRDYVTVSNTDGTLTLQGPEYAGENLEDLAA